MTNLDTLLQEVEEEEYQKFENNFIINSCLKLCYLESVKPQITKAYEQGRKSILDEFAEEQRKLLQGFAYKKLD